MSHHCRINWSYLSYDLEAVGLIEDWNGLLMAKLNWNSDVITLRGSGIILQDAVHILKQRCLYGMCT